MVKGYVLISVKPGKEMDVYRGLKKIKDNLEITPLLGDIDFLLVVEANEPNEIARIVIKHIRIISGVVRTKTLVEDKFMKQFEDLASE